MEMYLNGNGKGQLQPRHLLLHRSDALQWHWRQLNTFFSGRDGFANRFSFADLPPHPHLHHHESNEVLEWQPLA